MKGVVSCVSVMGLLAIMALVLFLSAGHGARAGTTYVDGDWTIDRDTILQNGTWEVNGSVHVLNGTLTVSNATLVVSGSVDGHELHIEGPGALVAEDSEIKGGAERVLIVTEGSVRMDRTTLSMLVGTECLAGEMMLEGCNLHDGSRLLHVLGGNVTVHGCRFWNYSSLAISIDQVSQPNARTHLRVEECEFGSPPSLGTSITMSGSYNRDIVSDCDVSILNCTFDGGDRGGEAFWAWSIHGPMSLDFSGNHVEGHRYGVSISSSGPEIRLSGNTYTVPIDGVGLQLSQVVSIEGAWPRIENETVVGTRGSIGIQTYGATPCLVFRGLNITGCQWGILATGGSTIEVHDSRVLLARGWDFVCNRGTINLYDCEHEYYGLVEAGGGQIDEYQIIDITSVTWQNGHRLYEGLTVLENETGVVIATVDNAHPGLRTAHLWHVDPDGSWLTTNARATLWMDGLAFQSPFYYLKGTHELSIMLTDDIVPSLTVLQPSEGSLHPTPDLEVCGTWMERGSGVGPVRIQLDDGGWIDAVVEPNGTWRTMFEAVPDGIHDIIVNIADLAGNSMGVVVHRVLVDTVPPWVEVLSPYQWVDRSPVRLIARTELLAQAFVDYAPVPVLDDGMFTAVIYLVEGENTVHIRVIDAVGRRLDTTYVIHLDTVEPVLAVESPVEGAWTNADPVLVEGQVQGAVEVEVNGQLVAVVGGRFSQAIDAPEGLLMVVVRATDLAGNVAQAVRTVHVDRTAPLLTTLSPPSGGATRDGHVVLGGTVLDAAPAMVMVGGTTVEAIGGAWSADVLLAEGYNDLQILIRDAAGNSVTAPFNITRDTTPPKLSTRLSVYGIEVEPGVELYTRAGDAVLELFLDEECLVDVTGMDTMDLPDGGSTFVILLLPGPNGVTVWARDLLGNAAPEVRYDVTVDRVAPRLAIWAPLDGSDVRAATVSVVVGTDEPCLATVNGFQPFGGEGHTFNVSVELELGRNTIHVMVEDRAGNRAFRTVNVTRLWERGAGEAGPGDRFLEGWIAGMLGAFLLGLVLLVVLASKPRTRAMLIRALERQGERPPAGKGAGQAEPVEGPQAEAGVPPHKPPPPGAEGGEQLPPPAPMPWYPPGMKGIQPAVPEPAQGGAEEGEVTIEGPGFIY